MSEVASGKSIAGQKFGKLIAVEETEESVLQVEGKENREPKEEDKVALEVNSDNAVVTDDGTSPLIVFGAVTIVLLAGVFVAVSKKVLKKTDAVEIASEEADE